MLCLAITYPFWRTLLQPFQWKLYCPDLTTHIKLCLHWLNTFKLLVKGDDICESLMTWKVKVAALVHKWRPYSHPAYWNSRKIHAILPTIPDHAKIAAKYSMQVWVSLILMAPPKLAQKNILNSTVQKCSKKGYRSYFGLFLEWRIAHSIERCHSKNTLKNTPEKSQCSGAVILYMKHKVLKNKNK